MCPRLPEGERARLKAVLEIWSDTIESGVGLLDDLSLVRLLLPRHARLIGLLNLAGLLSRWGETTLAKAEFWSTGRATRKAMLLHDRRDDLSVSPFPDISQADWDRLSRHSRARLERSVHRHQRNVLRQCRQALDRLWWFRVGLVCDAASSRELCCAYCSFYLQDT